MENSIKQEKQPSAYSLLIETNSLISLPEVCLKLREVIADSSHCKKDIADIIVHDPALTTRLLRIVNSAYYGLGRSVRDISHALTILGEHELKNLVVATSIVKTMDSIRSHMDINCFWRSSIFSAVMARNLATHCNYADKNMEEFFISGLLLNVGKLLLYYSEPELLAVVKEEMLISNRPDFEIEKEQMGFDHTDVGVAMAKSWNFSERLTNCISSHHQNISGDTSLEQQIMFLTGYISDQLDFKFPKQVSLDNLDLNEDGLMDELQLSNEQFCVIMNSSYEGYLLAHEAFCGGRE